MAPAASGGRRWPRQRAGAGSWSLLGSFVAAWRGSLHGPRIGRLVARDIVGFDPAGGADRKARLGARRELARGLPVAAREGGLGGGEIGVGEVAFAAVGHGQILVG